ncbi:glycosyltransferase family 2 protein [Klebsiella michiganensis]|uniref:glycosyltransferase family 2 protein n=1 Tax=Klebsiella michiganensis TaxID=1134687 RepID=UPI00294A96C1|nr:glycosyltransferase family 2 protein [Klebsiella michiganensis]MDV5444982.1 glycosyltransferase family 2 protein [Klebsiella michiganensis]
MKEINSKVLDIICPLYNKEKYIEDFLSSLRILPSDKVNIILIDDGSYDSTKEKIDSYVLKNKINNVYYFHKKNGGVSSARNKGIVESVSDYIWFCDPDDLITNESLNILQKVDNLNDDIVVCGYITAFEENQIEITTSYKKERFTTIDFLTSHDYFTKKNAISTVWNKIYKRQFIANIRFPEDMNHSEDRYFNLSLLKKNGTVLTCDLIIYRHKRYSANTLSTTKDSARINDIIKADLYNLVVLSGFKNIKKEKKIHVYRISRENACFRKENTKILSR